MAEENKSRTVVVCSGGDWEDASFTIMRVRDGLEMKALEGLYQLDQYGRASEQKFLTFPQWLAAKGYAAEDTEIEEYWED